MEIDIKLAYDDLENVKLLFNEYTAMLGVNLAFQGYDAEIKNLLENMLCPLEDYTLHIVATKLLVV